MLYIRFVGTRFGDRMNGGRRYQYRAGHRSRCVGRARPFPFRRVPPDAVPMVSCRAISFLTSAFFPDKQLAFSTAVYPSGG